MKVAVLTLCRDRLDYTIHCFANLKDLAGCPYDHFVLDQASIDGTTDWLDEHMHEFAAVSFQSENVGIHRGHNILLDLAGPGYDVYVTFDNDCEVVLPNTLLAAATVANHAEWIVSPSVRGLIYTPEAGAPVIVNGERVGPYQEIGGIFRTMPARFVRDYRFDESLPYWGRDEWSVGQAAAHLGIGVGYLLDWHVNHYRTTRGQQAELPGYFARKLAEM